MFSQSMTSHGGQGGNPKGGEESPLKGASFSFDRSAFKSEAILDEVAELEKQIEAEQDPVKKAELYVAISERMQDLNSVFEGPGDQAPECDDDAESSYSDYGSSSFSESSGQSGSEY